jgi:transposase
MEAHMNRNGRRKFSVELKAEAVRVYHARLAQGATAAQIARDLGVHHASLRQWVAAASPGPTGEPALTESERTELRRLRREVDALRLERDFVKKAAAYFAKEHP